jgi:hypothetical protein
MKDYPSLADLKVPKLFKKAYEQLKIFLFVKYFFQEGLVIGAAAGPWPFINRNAGMAQCNLDNGQSGTTIFNQCSGSMTSGSADPCL